MKKLYFVLSKKRLFVGVQSQFEQIRMFQGFSFGFDLLDCGVVDNHLAQDVGGNGVLGRLVKVT